ncbi:MAG: peptidyl-prolyl cis-trans isomerase [Deltaproteobacteria bacterium]|nr:peptidyl-prolyl cis-trans isomerase [Deltaproteobacteria bacterium]
MIRRLGTLVAVLTFAIGALSVGCTMAEDGKPQNPNDPIVLMSTSMGDVKIELFQDKAPKTVENFLGYVNDKFYDGTVFHRVIPRFMIQGGGFMPDMKQKPTKAPIKNEAGNGLKNETGTLAMARTPDVDSATAQFFINVKDNDFLNHKDDTIQGFGYCVFGKVIEGLKVVQKIEAVQTDTRGMYEDVPVDAVVIRSMRVVSAGK